MVLRIRLHVLHTVFRPVMYTPSRNLSVHPCPAEGCPARLKSQMAFIKHLRKYHPEMDTYTSTYTRWHFSFYN